MRCKAFCMQPCSHALFLMSVFRSARTGGLRLRIEVHKTPIEGRAIFNMTRLGLLCPMFCNHWRI